MEPFESQEHGQIGQFQKASSSTIAIPRLAQTISIIKNSFSVVSLLCAFILKMQQVARCFSGAGHFFLLYSLFFLVPFRIIQLSILSNPHPVSYYDQAMMKTTAETHSLHFAFSFVDEISLV